jgi:hypothetical protein
LHISFASSKLGSEFINLRSLLRTFPAAGALVLIRFCSIPVDVARRVCAAGIKVLIVALNAKSIPADI